MAIKSSEMIRRRETEAIISHLVGRDGRIDTDTNDMRTRILAEFTKKLDGKLKNLQEGEGIVVTFAVDIVGVNGKIRGGSGAQRNMPEYIAWRTAVFERDSYTCQACGDKKRLNAHHIKTWTGYPDLRFDLTNGITLCFSCHAKKHPHIGFSKGKIPKIPNG